ncbi:uncharacterized protein B0H18DRAFT_601989 [Fomitopsis serialis]|uniref:uncharacterized protein n=1 Tax=Fomitopsis serialis TaxID=139415 RepID=UPI002007A9DB|nr:uncharacterized protein B0H18DRAFT_601989 [Neoantrodia serialis]KAH9933801.1 hypothetical protein B0H18DRAFT_601989 [Neoantrodia serialis]
MEFLVPRRGTYLCLQLDPVKMVEPLNDPALSAAARDLRMQKYIALVSDIDELPMPNKPDHKCYVELVGSGLCREDEDAYMKSSMCTPIFPATEHPLSRRPLRPVPSFPFPNCYHHSFAALTVRIPNKLYNHEHAVTLNQRDLLADNIYVSEDCRMRDALADAKSGVAAAPQDDVSEDLHGLHSATSSVIRELVRQGVPVVYADDSQAETAPVAVASARGHESGGNVETDGGGKTVEEAMAASEELEPSVAGPGPHRYEGLASLL